MPKWIPLFSVACLFLLDCVQPLPQGSPPPPVGPPPPEIKAEPAPPMIKETPRDDELFWQELTPLLSALSDKEYGDVSDAMERFVKNHRESKWALAAQSTLLLLKERESYRKKYEQLQVQLEKQQVERAKLFKENEQLKKESRLLEETLENLKRENEQLKRDLEMLKNVELELNKREKMLR